MAFAEALSDDGSLTGRGRPVFRGLVTGVMTAAGGIGHTLPFLIHNFHVALRRGNDCGGGRAWDYQLRPPPVHGYAAGVVHGASGCGRRTRVRRGNFDREFVTRRALSLGAASVLESRLDG